MEETLQEQQKEEAEACICVFLKESQPSLINVGGRHINGYTLGEESDFLPCSLPWDIA